MHGHTPLIKKTFFSANNTHTSIHSKQHRTGAFAVHLKKFLSYYKLKFLMTLHYSNSIGPTGTEAWQIT